MADLNKLLCNLELYGPVKEQRTNKGVYSYKCCCPSHSDKHPSLVVTQLEDSRILIKCWAGCTAQEILDALDLKWKVLMPENKNYNMLLGRREKRPSVDEWLVAICDANKGKFFSRQDKISELKARKNLLKQKKVVHYI